MRSKSLARSFWQRSRSCCARATSGRIAIKDKDGKEVMSFPLTVGVIGAVLAPTLAAVGAVAALVTEFTIVVERRE